MSFLFDSLLTRPRDKFPLGLPTAKYLRLCAESVPKQLGIALSAYYSNPEDDVQELEMMMELGVAGSVISELLEHDGFRKEFVPPGVVSTTLTRHYIETPPRYWWDFPDMKALYCSNGLSLQLALFDASRSPTVRQQESLAFGMSHLDHFIAQTGTLDPKAHEPILAGEDIAEWYAELVGNVFERIGKWSDPLAHLRNVLLVAAGACLEDKPLIQNMRRFVQSGEISYLDFDITA